MIQALSRILELSDFDEQQRSMVKLITEMQSTNPTELSQILELLHDYAGLDSGSTNKKWPQLVGLLVSKIAQIHQKSALSWSPPMLQRVAEIYDLVPDDENLRNQLLGLLAAVGTESALEIWEKRLCDAPPQLRSGIVLAFAPLMHHEANLTQSLFDQLFTRALGHLPVAAAVLDLANYAYRVGILDPHPALGRVEQLSELLGHLAAQMGRIEEGNIPETWDPAQISQTVSDAVALMIPLCDAMALIEHHPAIGKLNQTLGLRHRRLQTEAAAALAKMGDENGRKVLIGLAEHPNVRTRVLAYADELGLGSQISLEYQGDIATAEAHLATWLCEPEQMGIAPSEMTLLDNRELNWPSYEHPIHCYLFQYTYGKGENAYRNVGISGPLTHAFAADINQLSKLATYAAFAGWQTTHQEVFSLPFERAAEAMPGIVSGLLRLMNEQEYVGLQPVALGGFFGEYQLVASGKTQDPPSSIHGTLILNEEQADWIEAGNPDAPIDWQLALDIWRGQRLLANFNSLEQFGQF